MQITNIEAKTLPEAWFQCIHQLLGGEGSNTRSYVKPSDGVHKYVVGRGSFEGQERLEFDFVVVRVEYPSSRPLVPDVPLGIPPPTTQDYVNDYMAYLMTGEKRPNEDYTYGEDLEKQIPEVIRMYRENGHNTNQAYMVVGNSESIFLKDPQCLRGIDTRVYESKLHFFTYFRSWDLWAGFPSNLAAIQLLKEYMSSEIGVDDGELVACSKGLHLYDHTWEVARQVVYR